MKLLRGFHGFSPTPDLMVISIAERLIGFDVAVTVGGDGQWALYSPEQRNDTSERFLLPSAATGQDTTEQERCGGGSSESLLAALLPRHALSQTDA
jgi:hypothetical protein